MKNDTSKVDTSKYDTEHFLENTRVGLIHESRSKSIVFSSDALCGFSCSYAGLCVLPMTVLPLGASSLLLMLATDAPGTMLYTSHPKVGSSSLPVSHGEAETQVT